MQKISICRLIKPPHPPLQNSGCCQWHNQRLRELNPPFCLSKSLGKLNSHTVAKPEGGAIAPSPHGLSTKMQNKKNITFLALLRLFLHRNGLKSDLKHLLKQIFRGANLSKHKLKTLKMPKNKQSDLITRVKLLNIGFINKYIINLGIEGESLQY